MDKSWCTAEKIIGVLSQLKAATATNRNPAMAASVPRLLGPHVS